MLKKTYEAPEAQLFQLSTKEELMNESNLSVNYGFTDEDPFGNVGGV